MKKALFIVTLLFSVSAFAQEKPKPDFKEIAEKAKADVDKKLDKKIKELQSVNISVDTLDIPDSAKYIKIKDRLIPVAAFTQSVPVFLSADAWGAVLEIINSRDYGKIPATTIGQIIQAIGQQLPRKEN
ncbi:hypothetical protein [Sediminibacterium sp.]|uniref:hypothetical protein n=1 Tax=Sediminibacterium sp. TaxID=1917865 RepID=UPI003F6972AF